MDNQKNINEKQNLISLGKSLSKFVVGMEGNISKKIKSSFIIKSSGAELGDLTENSLITYNKKWQQVDNHKNFPSMEIGFHKFLLNFNNVNVVSHTHPTNTMKILCSKKSKKFSNYRIFPDQVVFNGIKSCLVPYATPGEDLTNIIIKKVNKFIKNEGFFPKLILLENHGIIACGKNENECIIITEICEKAAEIFVGSKSLGGTIFLKFKKVKQLSNNNRELYRKSKL
jgi:L-fuculose-phosphate aldolase